MDKNKLNMYAKVILKSGLNLEKGEKIAISHNADSLELAREIAKEAYKMGALDVELFLGDEIVKKDFFTYASEDALKYVNENKLNYMMSLADARYHRVSLVGHDPYLLKDIDSEVLSSYNKIASKVFRPYMTRVMNNEVKWVVAACSTPAWANTVFEDDDNAYEKLWEAIFDACRINTDDPLKAWEEHISALKSHEQFLNENDFEYLHYKGDGTDLKVYLVENHIWVGGTAYSKDGQIFNANVPTEEVFSMPHSYKVDGKLRSTKPLVYMGNIIDGMDFVFENGKVVSYDAKVGKETLDIIMKADENSVRLGEVAIVGDNSPISNTGILFKETLFDENASCHFAFGNAYGENVKDGDTLTSEQKKEIGMNESNIHVDFMVGGPTLTITGYKKDGTAVVILKDGNWIV